MKVAYLDPVCGISGDMFVACFLDAGLPLEVRVKNASYIQPTRDERLTLVTCHPYGSLRNRLIVIARPVSE